MTKVKNGVLGFVIVILYTIEFVWDLITQMLIAGQEVIKSSAIGLQTLKNGSK